MWAVLAAGATAYLSTSDAPGQLAQVYSRPAGDLASALAEAEAAKIRLATLQADSTASSDRVRALQARLDARDREVGSLRAEFAALIRAQGEARDTAAAGRPPIEVATLSVPTQTASLPPSRAGKAPPIPHRAPRVAAAPADARQTVVAVAQPAAAVPGTLGSARVLNRQVSSVQTGSLPLENQPQKLQDRPSTAQTVAPPAPAPFTTNEASAPETAPSISFGEPIVTAAAPAAESADVALRLSSAPSVESLRFSWRVLKERHGSLLQGLTPLYRQVSQSATGPTYQLVAGPVLSRSEADQLCGLLQLQNVACTIDQFAGNRL